MSDVKMTELDNGFRIVTNTVPSVDTIALGVWAGVGTRQENLNHNGAAHMVEHVLFKGTQKRNSLEIVKAIEDSGGMINAYTSREVTSYHCHLLKEHTELALDVLADMTLNYTMPNEEVERERQVILQEIGMCHDTPDDVIHDHYFETAYPDQALGAPILGTSETVSNMNRGHLMDYAKRFYTPARMVLSVAGNLNHDEIVEKADALFQDFPPDIRQGKISAAYAGGEFRQEKNLEQAHIMLGFQGISRPHEGFFAAQALANILGGGMSSRLFQELREKRGLVYNVHSFHAAFTDDGQLIIYAGTGPDDLGELIPVMCGEMQKITSTITQEELGRAKSYLKSRILMSRESMMARADQQAKHLLLQEKIINIEDIKARIDALDINRLHAVAERILSSRPTLAALGPVKKLESFASLTGRLNPKIAA